MFGYEPHEHLLFAYKFFAKPECNRWKSLEKRKKRRVTWQTHPPLVQAHTKSPPLRSIVDQF
jgi:hypothetical protein